MRPWDMHPGVVLLGGRCPRCMGECRGRDRRRSGDPEGLRFVCPACGEDFTLRPAEMVQVATDPPLRGVLQ